MKKILSLSFACAALLPLLLAGCSSGGSNSNNAMNAQMGVLADEVTRLDQALQETRGQLQQEQARVAELESRLGGSADTSIAPSQSASAYSSASSEPYAGIYRTPSGFELPAISVQKALKAAGFYNGEMDGKVGPDTREAVRNFQRANGLTPDGIIGKTTWSLLKKHLS